MTFAQLIDPAFMVSGFGVGLLVGLTGVGGGSLMTPLLILLFGIHPSTAVGSDLLYAAITKTAGAAVHGWNRTVEWRVTARLAAGSIPAAALTLVLLYALGLGDGALSRVVSAVLGVAVMLTAVALIFRHTILRFAAGRLPPLDERRVTILTVATGVVLGVLVSLSSVGAGALGMTVLVMLYPRIPTVRLVASDIAHAVPLTLVAGIGHWLLGTVNWLLIGSLLVGSIPGIVLGSRLAVFLPDGVLRPVLAGILLIVGYRVLAI
ncbi:MAG TPA: sulfite exporter TauE/SafE family protein [Stellaceae bacterium]|nr:sulfite exporter TauE/SafE family protein [Stellaceae bacterium]